jgi:acyl-CoA reductase-like NAD-dependent aldehyde dehydrogenase
MQKKYEMWIGGKWVDAASCKTHKVVNPATEEEIAQIPLGDKADVDRAVEAAQNAFPVWSQKSPEERSRILKEIAALIRKHTQELIDMDILDHGSPVGLAASVWTRDQEKGIRLANAIQAGMVWVNTHNAGGGLPWGGFKESGFGKEGGIHGLKEYTQLKGICVNLVSSRKATL